MLPGRMSAGNRQDVDAVWLQVGRKSAGCLLLSGGSRQEIGKRKEGVQEACKIEGLRPDSGREMVREACQNARSRPGSNRDLGVGGCMGGGQN